VFWSILLFAIHLSMQMPPDHTMRRDKLMDQAVDLKYTLVCLGGTYRSMSFLLWYLRQLAATQPHYLAIKRQGPFSWYISF
jgi:hypothetical protein